MPFTITILSARIHSRVRRAQVIGGCLVVALTGLWAFAAEDPFAANVRPTEAQTPADERRALEVPPGFEVQLVANEPDINKPLNLAFDSVGRLWVTTSREYPRPAPPDRPALDRLMIFEDFGPDGRARKVTEFAAGLNIPIGVYPHRSANKEGRVTWKAVVWSIPNIWLLEDTDDDGKADKKSLLYGPFDFSRDTHGNQASFRRGFDGWMYATHGYNNDSHVAGADGNRVDMNSGNTYRVALNGSRIEHHTWGQVNPFGLAWDPEGNLYSSDCHSDPIYLLLGGGYYPSFGKPHDGLGFAPNMMEQIRGSTAIDGISYYADDLWPEAYRDSVFVGDVMMSRVFRDLAEPRGSGKVARPQPDFVVSRDPWFRPVDTTFGPDGALYIGDFYNRIIGHYEVPLDHPGRDRERGRIWRVVWSGSPLRSPRIAQDLPGLLGELASPSLARRMLAMNDLADRFGPSAAGSLRQILQTSENRFQRVHALWLLDRFDDLDDALLTAAARHAEALVRIHAMRIITERALRSETLHVDSVVRNGFTPALEKAAVAALQDVDPQVRRCAVEALGHVPRPALLRPVLDLRHSAQPTDPHLFYAVRQALRNLLSQDRTFAAIFEGPWSEADLRACLDVAPAVNSALAARFLLRHVDLYANDRGFTQIALHHAARYAAPAELERLVTLVREGAAGDLDFQRELFRSLQEGIAQGGQQLTAPMKAWGTALAAQLLASVRESGGWVNRPLEGVLDATNPWDFEPRPCADGRTVALLSSHPHGEQLTGRLRSRAFAAPGRLSFYVAGHDGFPGVAPGGQNFVRLCDAGTGAVLIETSPPRKDTAQKIEWDLAPFQGKSVVIEVLDGDTAGAFAWIAFGRLEPAALAPWPEISPTTVVARQIACAELVAASGGEGGELLPQLEKLSHDSAIDPSVRGAIGRLMSSNPIDRAATDLMSDATQPALWRGRLADAVFNGDREARESFAAAAWRDAPNRFQLGLASLGAVRADIAGELVERMADGRAPVGLLQDKRLRDRLRQACEGEARGRLDELVKGLPDEDFTLRRLIEERRAGFVAAKADGKRGREVFQAACAACHQVEGQGGLVGPQLTGIGTRGVERLCEDILSPSRNVDRAFWVTALTLKDGETESGLFRREEGAVIVLANSAGAEFSIPKKEIVERRESNSSVMPSNFGEALSPADFNHLLAFLMGQHEAKP